MPRPSRDEFPNAIYHITARGDHREEIFFHTQDRMLFLKTLGEAVQKYQLIVYAFCLMPNHYHLLIKTPLGNLSKCMAWLQGTYTARFNHRHHLTGHLFQGRYKSFLITDESYVQRLIYYIHLNPIKSEKTSKTWSSLKNYKWSSHLSYSRGIADPSWLNLEWLPRWGDTIEKAKENYLQNLKLCFESEE